MNKSSFILNNEQVEIESITYDNGELSIKTTNNNVLNISFNFDIDTIDTGVRENISSKIYTDQNFVTEKYGYVFDIGKDVYLTKNEDEYLLEVNIPKVDILIPPFDNVNNVRLEEKDNYDDLELHQLDVKVYFK